MLKNSSRQNCVFIHTATKKIRHRKQTEGISLPECSMKLPSLTVVLGVQTVAAHILAEARSSCDFSHHFFAMQSSWWRLLASSVMVQIVTGRFHQDWGEETGRRYEGRCELSQPLLSEPLQGCLPAGSYRYGEKKPKQTDRQTDMGSLYTCDSPHVVLNCAPERFA